MKILIPLIAPLIFAVIIFCFVDPDLLIEEDFTSWHSVAAKTEIDFCHRSNNRPGNTKIKNRYTCSIKINYAWEDTIYNARVQVKDISPGPGRRSVSKPETIYQPPETIRIRVAPDSPSKFMWSRGKAIFIHQGNAEERTSVSENVKKWLKYVGIGA